jgi:hypothetical protein
VNEEEEEEEGDEGEKKDERRLDGEEVCANSCGSGGRVPRKEATTASEPNANSKSKSPVQRREQVTGVGMGMGMGTAGSNGCKAPGLGPNLLHCTAPRQEEWRCTAKRNQSTNKQGPAPRSRTEDTELMHKRHKDALWCGLVADDIAGSGGGCWAVEQRRSVLRPAKWERALCLRKANANACKKSNQATMTGSRGRDGGARGRGRLGGRGRRDAREGDLRREAAREDDEEEVEGKFNLLQIARHASPTEVQSSPHCKLNATLHFHHVPSSNSTPRASCLTPHTPHRTPRLHLPRFAAPQITPRLFPWQNLLPARAKVLLLLLLLLCSS